MLFLIPILIITQMILVLILKLLTVHAVVVGYTLTANSMII
jgi:hypothetical protein